MKKITIVKKSYDDSQSRYKNIYFNRLCNNDIVEKLFFNSLSSFFASNYLIDGRVEKAYKGFIESMYGINELNHHAFTFENVLDLPLPLFQDYIEYQLNEKKKAADKQRRESQTILNQSKAR